MSSATTAVTDNNQDDNVAFFRWFARETALFVLTAFLGFVLFLNVMVCAAPFTRSPWADAAAFDFIAPFYALSSFVLSCASAYLTIRAVCTRASGFFLRNRVR